MVIFMDYRIEELLPIISGLALEYGGYESTSITYEKAQELMEAVLFCLNEYQDSNPCAPARRDISTKEQYRIGMKLVFEKVERIRKIFNEITLQFEDFGVKCLYDTVQKGIPRFLKWYNIKFCPQNTILTLDYPLLADYGSLKGADAVINISWPSGQSSCFYAHSGNVISCWFWRSTIPNIRIWRKISVVLY
ncbi:MAG: hypothetical protein K2P25_03320 [Lachnospiraceae bacterium]|nr:hypothetical protein [Lachnospiraceae bacterium]